MINGCNFKDILTYKDFYKPSLRSVIKLFRANSQILHQVNNKNVSMIKKYNLLIPFVVNIAKLRNGSDIKELPDL